MRGGGAQALDDQRLGDVVGLGHRGMVGFALDREAGGAHRVDGGGGLVGKAGGKREQGIVIHGLGLAPRRAAGQAPPLAARRPAA